MLTPILADRVRRLVPLLSSTHDGEVIATRNAIGRELIAGGSDWHGLAASIGDREQPPTASPVSSELPSFGDLARACRDLDQGRLSTREREFVAQMCRLGFNRSPSPRQAEWLAAIFARLQRRTAA